MKVYVKTHKIYVKTHKTKGTKYASKTTHVRTARVLPGKEAKDRVLGTEVPSIPAPEVSCSPAPNFTPVHMNVNCSIFRVYCCALADRH